MLTLAPSVTARHTPCLTFIAFRKGESPRPRGKSFLFLLSTGVLLVWKWVVLGAAFHTRGGWVDRAVEWSV